MNPVKVLVAEDNPYQRQQLVESLSDQRGLLIVGAAENGLEAMRLMEQYAPQVLVCDMVMPEMDGFAVLAEIAHRDAGHRPQVIAVTALSRDDFITRAMDLGVAYYMVKPVNTVSLVQHIHELAGWHEEVPETPHASRGEEQVEQRVADMLLHMGVPVHLSGYRFLLRSVLMVLEHPERLGSITRTLYPAVASYYDTSASCVERSIRHAINMTWTRFGAPAFETVLGRRVLSANEKPTNCELIALLSERTRLQGWDKSVMHF